MKISQNITALLLLLIIGGGMFVYKSFFAQDVIIEIEQVAQEALAAQALYNEVNSINLDREFLDSPLVVSLINFYVMPSIQLPGRPNPFVAIPANTPTVLVVPREIESIDTI